MTIIFDGTQGITTPAETANNSVTTPVVKSSANLVFQTNGTTEAMRITSGGKVLVGTNTSPSAPGVMQVLNASSAAYTQYNKGTDGGGVVGSEGTGLAFYTYTGNIGSETYTERMRINSTGVVTMPYQPAFRVSSSVNQSISGGTPTPIQSNVVAFDIGNNFNTSTYRFTAPVPGRYLFTMAIQFTGTVIQPHSTVAINGSSQEPWIDWGGSSVQAAFQARVMNLAAGDTAQLYVYAGNAGTTDGARCVFSGHLIG